MARRRLVWYAGRRKAKLTEVVRAQQNPPYPFQANVQPRRLRGMLPRRGRAVTPPWPQAPANSNQPAFPWAPIRQAGWHPRWPQTRLRRGRPVEPPWPQAQAPPPPACPPQTVRVRVRVAFQRRGRAAQPPWVGAAAPGPPVLPLGAARQTTHRFAILRRRRPAEPPWLDAPPLPAPTRARVRPAPIVRRGRALTVPSSVPAVPMSPVRLRVRVACTRRGHLAQPPWPQAVTPPSPWPPQAITARRRSQPRPVRRGRCVGPPWPQATAPQAPAFVPMAGMRHRVPLSRTRRGRLVQLPWPQIAPTPTRDLRVLVGAPVAKWVERGPAGKWQAGQPVAKWTVCGPAAKWRVGAPVRKWPPGPPTP